MQRPEISVLVASHDRPLRLRWLLNALHAQTLDRRLWEVIVCHDSAGPETDALLAEHPLAATGTLRWQRFEPGSAAAAAKRTAAAWLAHAPTVVFTDDDCRPPEQWLERVRAAVERHPGAIVQGPIVPDPDEAAMLRSPFPHTQSFSDVPRVWAETGNIAYPRALVMRVGGLAEDLHVGEDTDLSLRVQRTGAPLVGDRAMLTYHCVEDGHLWDRIRTAARWEDEALLFKRHPRLRAHAFLGIFWKREHALFLLALGGAGLRRRTRLWPLLGLPWALARNDHGQSRRGRIRQLVALPGWALIDAAEIAVLARGSVRYRSLLL